MRKIEYLSPTGIATYLENKEKFYMNYLADIRAPRDPQTQPMSVGSSFDAYCKSYLHTTILGKNHKDSNKFDFRTLFEAQVEPHNRDWAIVHGKNVFDDYVACGALAEFHRELSTAIGEPRFELSVQGTVSNSIHSIPFLGKPDVFYTSNQALRVITDWKVNGYCSKTGASPAKGYVRILPDNRSHPECVAKSFKGITVNGNEMYSLDKVDISWARQTTIYAWLCGCEVGSTFVQIIDQVACNNRQNPQPGFMKPAIRFAQHRYVSNIDFQFAVYLQAAKIWESVQSPEVFFDHMSPDDSASRCRQLDHIAAQMHVPRDEKSEFDLLCEI